MGDLAIIAPRPATLHFEAGNVATLDLGVAEPGVLVISATTAEFAVDAPRLATLVFKAEALQGADGADAGHATWVAGEALSALKVVRAVGGQVFVQDAADLTDIYGCVGLTKTASAALASVDVAASGFVVSDALWSFVAGPVYLGADGALTQVPPSSPGQAFHLRVGTAIS